MQRLWRLYRAVHGPGLDGIGGTIASGRWHTTGTRAAYFGATAAIVVLERLAHIDPKLLPHDLWLGFFEFKKTVAVETIEELPRRWIENEAGTQRLGTEWLRACAGCLLEVPSAVLPEESNYLFNPRHTAAEELRLVQERPFSFDPRLLLKYSGTG